MVVLKKSIRQNWMLPNFEYTYINIYQITKDFDPEKPGKDYIGILKHLHVDNEYLERYGKFGVEYNPFDLPWDGIG